MEHWKEGKRQDVHELLQAAHNPCPSSRAHAFQSKEDVLYIQDLVWLSALALELKDLGLMSAKTVQDTWSAASSLVQGGWGPGYFGKHSLLGWVMVTTSWNSLQNTSLNLELMRSVQSL